MHSLFANVCRFSQVFPSTIACLFLTALLSGSVGILSSVVISTILLVMFDNTRRAADELKAHIANGRFNGRDLDQAPDTDNFRRMFSNTILPAFELLYEFLLNNNKTDNTADAIKKSSDDDHELRSPYQFTKAANIGKTTFIRPRDRLAPSAPQYQDNEYTLDLDNETIEKGLDAKPEVPRRRQPQKRHRSEFGRGKYAFSDELMPEM